MNRFAKLIGLGAGSFALLYQARWLALAKEGNSKQVGRESMDDELSKLKLFSVTDQTELANEIAFYFKTKIGKLQVIRKNEEEKPTVNVFEDVHSKEIYLICSFNLEQESIKDSIDDLVTSIYALKSQGPSKVNVVLPYYSNPKEANENGQVLPFSEEKLSEILECAGADKIFTVNMHNKRKNVTSHIPLVELDVHKLCASYFKEQKLENLVIVYANEELQEKVRDIQAKLEQDGHKVEIQFLKESNSSKVNPSSINGRDVLFVDNIVDSGKPLYNISNYLNKLGARSIHMFATHAVIDNETIDFIDYSPIKELVITNTLPLDSSHLSPKINQISVAKMIADIIAQSTFHKNLSQLHQEGML